MRGKLSIRTYLVALDERPGERPFCEYRGTSESIGLNVGVAEVGDRSDRGISQ